MGEVRPAICSDSAELRGVNSRTSTIIERINQQFGTDFGEHVNNMLDGITDALAADEEMQAAARNNDKANFGLVLKPKLMDELADHHAQNGDFVNRVYGDADVARLVVDHVLEQVRNRILGEGSARTMRPGELGAVPPGLLDATDVRPFDNCVPVVDLKVAAGGFSPTQVTEPLTYDWVALPVPHRPSRDLFVAQVEGESMNRKIPNGAWCLWRLHPAGSRDGRIVLAQHRDIDDPEHGGSFTVKRFESEKVESDDGGWTHGKVVLHPESTDPSFEPIVLEGLAEGELRIVAEFVAVLG